MKIRLSGGSHSKRHIVSPVEVRLLDCIESLKRFSYDYINSSDLGELDYLNRIKFNKDYKHLLEKLINYSYYYHDTLRSPDYRIKLNKILRLSKLILSYSTSDYNEILFLHRYDIQINNNNLELVFNEKEIKQFNGLLKYLINRIDNLNNSNYIKSSKVIKNKTLPPGGRVR